jgi:hypothetical protein
VLLNLKTGNPLDHGFTFYVDGGPNNSPAIMTDGLIEMTNSPDETQSVQCAVKISLQPFLPLSKPSGF